MKSSSLSTFRLLEPHARPFLWALLLVVFLGGLSALGQRSVYLLLEPTWDVLFPEAQEEPAVPTEATEAAGAAGPAGLFPELDERLTALRRTAIDLIIGPRDEIDPARPMGPLLRIVAVVALIALITALFQYGFLWMSRWVSLRMVVSLRLSLARHLIGLSVRYHGQRSFGDLLSRVSSDVSTTLAVVQISLRELVQQPLLAIASLAGAFFIAPAAATFVVVGLPVLAVPIAVFARRVRRSSTKSLTKLGASIQVLSQMFQGVRTVKAFRGEEREIERYRKINESYVRNTMRMVRAIAMSSAWTTLFSFVGLGLLILLVGLLSTRSPEMRDPGRMATFFLLIASAYTNIKTTTRVLTRAQESVGASVRLLELLDQEEDIVEKPDAHTIDGLGAGLVLDRVGFTYPGTDGPAIDELSLEILPGETLALVGHSGAGKSTIMDLVARFIDPQDGRITVDGHDLRDLTLDSWTAQYGMVGQVPFLFHASIEENIGYGRPSATREEIETAARAAGIHEFVEGLPDGYATNVDEAGSRLSGGQRQRITIARAFLKSAPLLLLDEATSALDPESEAVVQEALEQLMKDRTVIVIAHRLSTIRRADRIVVLDGGRLAEIGSHEELLVAGGAYARMHAAQHPVEASRA